MEEIFDLNEEYDGETSTFEMGDGNNCFGQQFVELYESNTVRQTCLRPKSSPTQLSQKWVCVSTAVKNWLRLSSYAYRVMCSKDHASVQLNIGHLDHNGVYTDAFTTFALSGDIRAHGDADSALDRLWHKKKQELNQ